MHEYTKENSGPLKSRVQTVEEIVKTVIGPFNDKFCNVLVVDAAKSITRNVYTKYGPTAKEMYDKYEVVAKQYAIFTWRTLNRLSLFSQVAQVVVPTNAYWLKKYNQVVQQSR
ncbi:hypothetical protein Goari_006708 [Gossypium aridum]|uniref:Uncharacterized protein n=1 Tax=Gossypium aridum TaxID=34290 RepID=A0A7J8XQ18_GOSAI|nr:hypothetical protein [Gossypium aridum]